MENEVNNKDVLGFNPTVLPICINCEENEVMEKGMLLCEDCIIHLEGHV